MLRGALLMLAWFGETIRPTRNANLLGLEPQSGEELAALFKEVCAVAVVAGALCSRAGSGMRNSLFKWTSVGAMRSRRQVVS